MEANVDDFIEREILAPLRGLSKPLVVITGPTASGKTAFSLDVASVLGNAEVINGDSRQLYRYLNIGTAKIPAEERRGIAHHLLDVLDPKEEATAAWYKSRATSIIDDLHSRRRVPLLVGGSMLYVSAVVNNLSFAFPSDPVRREKLSAEYERDGGAALFQKLQKLDPDTAALIHVRNKPYLIRAIELCEIHGSASRSKTRQESPYQIIMTGIRLPKEKLAERINERTKELFRRGWIDEVKSLLARGYTAEDPAMKSQGYREIIEYLQTGKPSLADLQDLISSKTRSYAKRQMTWWKREDRMRWLDL